jgi:hypothetical protein
MQGAQRPRQLATDLPHPGVAGGPDSTWAGWRLFPLTSYSNPLKTSEWWVRCSNARGTYERHDDQPRPGGDMCVFGTLARGYSSSFFAKSLARSLILLRLQRRRTVRIRVLFELSELWL